MFPSRLRWFGAIAATLLFAALAVRVLTLQEPAYIKVVWVALGTAAYFDAVFLYLRGRPTLVDRTISLLNKRRSRS
jgi:hypothetical protein